MVANLEHLGARSRFLHRIAGALEVLPRATAQRACVVDDEDAGCHGLHGDAGAEEIATGGELSPLGPSE